MAIKKSWRDYMQSDSTEDESEKTTEKSTGSQKTGTWRDYMSDGSATSAKSTGSWRDYANIDATSIASGYIVNQVNNWLNNHNAYVSGYQNRYSGRKNSYEDAYVSDSSDWLNTVTQQKSSLDTEADAILAYMDQYRDYLDVNWMAQIRGAIGRARMDQSSILNSSTYDDKYWSSFGSEDLVEKYGSAEDAYKYHQRADGYSKKYNGMTYDDIQNVMGDLEDGEEKEWLTSYAGSVNYEEMKNLDTVATAKEIKLMEAELEQYRNSTVSMDLGEYMEGLEAREEAIKKKKDRLNKAQSVQKLIEWSSVKENEDFGQNSQYVNNVEYELFGKPTFTDDTYAYVNNPTVEDKRPLGAGESTARSLIDFEHSMYSNDTPLRNRDSSYARDALEQMTKDEVAIYNYYYATEGAEKANEYLNLIVNTLQARKDAQTAENVSKFAGEHPWLSSALSVGTSIGSGFEYLEDILEYGGDKLLGKDAKLGTNEAAIVTNAVRGTVADEVDWKIKNWDAFDFLYNTAMSGLDSLASTAFGNAGGVVLGLSAAAQGTNDALNRGMSDGQAFFNGLFSGVFEGLFESISIGNFNRLKEVAPEGVKDIIKNLGKSMLVNASEETLTELANITYDTLINGEFANYTMEELANGAWKEALNQVLEAGASGALMGLGMGGVANVSGYVQNKRADNAAIKQYGNKTDVLIQEGLESDVKSESYRLAQEYKQQTEAGNALTGKQIRQLLAANQDQITPKDLQKIKKAAAQRLTDLGQTEDVGKIAELATKRATGQELSDLEKSVLARSQYGAQVAKELLPESIADWAEDIGTRKVNYAAYNKKKLVRELLDHMTNATYKSLEERVGKEKTFDVSESGKATIRKSGKEISLGKNVEVAEFIKDKKTGKVTDMVLNVDGEKVKASEIDFADADQSYLYSAVRSIENITPADAQVIIRDYDPSSGLSVSEYLNGIDEGFTYGYYGYSEADLKAGKFATKLSDVHAKSAYELGQYAKKNRNTNKVESIKLMRTAVEAEAEKAVADGKEAPKAKKLTITYNDKGKIVDFDKAGLKKKLSTEQRAAPAFAEVMHEMGLGTNFELYSSYLNAKGERVYINEYGVEEAAPAGIYRKSDGTVLIDLNAYNGKELTLYSMAHELTHFIQQWSDTKYQVLADFLIKTYEKTDLTMHERVLREQARLKKIRKKDISYNEAFDEVVANAMMTMLSDGKVMERLNELKAQDADLAKKLWAGLKKLLNKFFRAYEKYPALFDDASDLMELKAEFEQMKNMWAEAFVEASENFQTYLAAKEAGLDIMPVEDGTMYSYSSLAEAAGFEAVENDDGTRAFTREGKKVSKVTIEDIENSPIGAFINFSLEMGDISDADAKKQKKMFADICTMACKTNDFAMTMQFVGSAVFTGMKANADKQYGTTYDFPSICTKTQAVIDAMSAKMKSLGRGLNTDEIVKLYADVFASGNPVPCPECYVFSRWIGIGGLLDNIKKYQDYYGNMAIEDVAAEYRKMKAEVSKFAEEQGISFGKAKGALTSKLTKEFNKLTEKVEKQQNQGEKVKPSDLKRLEELEPMMNTVKGMTWLENVYFADSSLKKVNPNFRVPDSVLFDLNNGEAFATKYKDAWAFRTTQGAGYGKAITPYAEARLGEGILVTNNTTNAIKGRAQGSLDNYFLQQKGKLDKQSREALKRARLKQKIQAFLGGQRFQSTSDARYENASDYLLAALEMQAMHGMVQAYTKVDGAVPAFSAWGFSINQSLMPLNGGLDADGNVKDTGVGGMKPSVAFENRKKHDTAGTITIGVNDNHIRAMFKQWVRDFIIPYHASGGKADVVDDFRRIQEGKERRNKEKKEETLHSTDYSRTQSDKVLSDDVLRWQGKTDAQIQRIHEIRAARIAILTGGKPNMTVVRSNRFLSALYDKFNGGEWDGVKVAKSKVESQIFPNEFWDQTVTYEESAKITKDYLEYCEDLGFLHRFSGMVPSNGMLVPVRGYNENGERVQLTDLAYKYDSNGNKTTEVEEFFWKVLTDRRMYDNSGNYLPQKVVTLNDTTTETVTGFAKNNQGREYDKAKAEALAKKIAGEQYSSQETDVDNDADSAYDGAKVTKETKQEVNPYGQDGKAEDHASFIRRMHEGSRRVKQVREIVFGYTPSSLLYASKTAEDTYRELKRLRIKCFLHKGLEYNFGGKTYKDPGETGALSDGSVAIYDKAFGDGIEYAGHEAFHVWKHSTERNAYVETLRRNINTTASVYGIKQADAVLREYFGGNVEALASKEAKAQFQEELYALVSGKIHSGTNEADLKTMFKDYAEVKAAWDALVKKQVASVDRKSMYSSQETDLDSVGNKLTKEQKAYFSSSKVRNRNGKLLVVYHGGTVENQFDTSRGGKGATQYGPGAYFTDSEYYAKEYTYYRGGDVKPYYLNIDKLFDDTDMGVTAQMPEWKRLEQILRDNGIEEKFIKKFADGGFAYMSRYLALKSGAKTSDSWEGSEKLNAMLREAGYQGIKGDFNDMHQYVVFDPEQAKFTSNKQPTSNPDLRYSTQETDLDSNRALLANAFEGISQNSKEYEMIQEYKGRIRLLNEYEEKLSKLNAEIHKMMFDPNTERDSKKLKELQEEAKKVEGHINRNDKKLLFMESAGPLRDVIDRERKKASQKTKDHIKEIQKNKRDRAEQTELRHKIRKTIRDLDKILNRGNKKQNVKEDMKGFVSKALELADYLFTDHISNDELIRKGITVRMTPNEAALVKETEEILSKLYDNADSLTDEEFTKLDAKRKANEDKLRDLLKAQRNERLNTPVYDLFNDLVTEYANLKNSSQDSVKAAYDEVLENSLRAFMGDADRVKILKNMRVADMTTEELNWLYRAYTMVLTNVRNANKFHVKGMTETIEQRVGRIAGDFGSRKIPDKKLAIAAQKLANKIGWDYEKLYYALDRIGSEAFTELIMNIADSENTVMQDIMEAVAFRDEIVENYGFNNWDVNKEIDREFLDNTGKKFKLTLGQLMSLYAYSRREGAWDHIEYGGFVFGEAALTNPKPADSYKLSKDQCEAITSLLTKEQKGYVEDMQKFLSETMGAKGNEVSMLLYGIKMFGEKNYFPIHIAGQFKAQAQESQAKAAAGFGSMSNAGFTHAQNPNAKAPFVLEGFNEVWSDHVNEMSRYHGTVPALEDLRRVMNRSTYSDSVAESQSIKQLMENSYGKEAVDYFDNLYREANSGAITDKLQKKSKKLLSLFRKNSVAYSLSVLIQQPASLVRAYALIDKKYFGYKGFGTITSGIAKAVSNKWTKAHTNAYNEMLKYAPGVTMAKEIGGFDTATGGSIRSHLLDTNKSLKQKWQTGTALEKGEAVLDVVDNNAIANLPNVADKIAWIEIWNACKRETVAKHKDIATNSDEFMQIVGERFTEVIRATQVYDSIFAKSPMLKSKNLAVQYVVSFMNEPNTVANMVESAVRSATRGNWKQGVRTGAVVIHSIIFTNVLKSIIYAMRDDDEDETYIEKYIEAIAGGMMDDFNALNYIPLVRDVWSVAQGYDVERADMAIVADAVDALNKVIQNGFKDTEDMTEEELIEFDKKCTEANWKLVESLAAFLGIPMKNIRREINSVFDHAKIASANAGMTTAASVWDTISDAVIDSIPFMSAKQSKTDKLYGAILSGDKTYLDRLKATYKTDSAYESAVRKALRENDPRIHAAAQARYDGNTEEYKRIFREIRDEGVFNWDQIMDAINSEENAIKNKLDPEKVTSTYSTSDFVQAVSMGDTEVASAAMDEIIATYVANGKTQAEAESAFASAVATSTHDAYSAGLLDEAGAENMLVEYAGKDEEEAASKVSYWAFMDDHPGYNLSESNVNDYREFAEPANISLDVFTQYINGTKGLETKYDAWGDVEVTKREQVLEVIDSLPLTWQQKDALYLAAGYAESEIWDVPW